MEEKKIVYKVVRKDNGQLVSASINNPSWKVEYRPNEWTKPKQPGSYLFCFNSLSAALSYFVDNSCSKIEFEIWQAEAVGIRKPAEYIVGFLFNWTGKIEEYMKEYWEIFRNGQIEKIKEKIDYFPTPSYTVLCKKIKLLKPVPIMAK